MTWEYFTGANKMNPIADNSIAKMCIGLTRSLTTDFLYKTNKLRSILSEEKTRECRKCYKCFKCFAAIPD